MKTELDYESINKFITLQCILFCVFIVLYCVALL